MSDARFIVIVVGSAAITLCIIIVCAVESVVLHCILVPPLALLGFYGYGRLILYLADWAMRQPWIVRIFTMGGGNPPKKKG